MAGIGFVLKKLVRRDDLIGGAGAYMHSALISCGAWIFMMLALGIVFMFHGGGFLRPDDLQAALFYNFAFSLIFTAPMHMVATRYIADSIYKHNVTNISASLLKCFALIMVFQALPVAWFYFYHLDLSVDFRLAAFLNFFLMSLVWVINVYLTALKNYAATTRAFLVGMLVVFVFTAWLMRGYGEVGILFGFDMGLAFIAFSLIGEVLSEYNYHPLDKKEFPSYFNKFFDLALSGTFYSLGVWGDKLVMAYAPESTLLKSGMRDYFEYNVSFFVAYIVMIPAIAMFILSVETNFFEHYRKFYREILEGVTFSRIESNHKDIMRSIYNSGRDVAIMQGLVCFVVMALAYKIFQFLHLAMGDLSMFHFAVFGSYLHVLALFELIVLSYFECWRATLWIQFTFCVSNILFTYIAMRAGFKYYGYGYFLSSLLTFLLSSVVLRHTLTRLPYCEFILNNIMHKRRPQLFAQPQSQEREYKDISFGE